MWNRDKGLNKICFYCNKELIFEDFSSCHYCKKSYCFKHKLAEHHDCPKVMAANYIEENPIDRERYNINAVKFSVSCKNCGFVSDYGDLEKVNQLRIKHIDENHCPSEKIHLQPNDKGSKNDYFIQKSYPTNQGYTWMYGCLENAKKILKDHHQDERISLLFKTKFSIILQKGKKFAYGGIDGKYPEYKIKIHKSLEKNNFESNKMVTFVLIHQLLHSIHEDWSETEVGKEGNRIANLGLFFDASDNQNLLRIHRKIGICDKIH